MPNKVETFLENYQKYVDLINSVDVEELTAGMTAQEVENLRIQIQSISAPSIGSKLHKKAKELLIEENPILKVAHYYPELNKFNFLTEEQIKKLDNHLKMFALGGPIFNLHRITFQTRLVNEIRDNLISCGIAEEKHSLVCNHCTEQNLTGYISTEKKEELVSLYKEYKETKSFLTSEKFLSDLDSSCSYCCEDFDIDETDDLIWKTSLILIKGKADVPRLK